MKWIFQPKKQKRASPLGRSLGLGLALWVLCLEAPAWANAPIVVKTEQGDAWQCEPTGDRLICNRADQGKPKAQLVSDLYPETGSWLTTDLLLKFAYLGLPLIGLMMFLANDWKSRLVNSRNKAFVDQLERLWDDETKQN